MTSISNRRAYAIVTLLCVLYIVAFVDRLILSLLVTPLKADLHLTDVQLGLLFGTAFALLFGAMGLPLGRLADKKNRIYLIGIAVTVWSVCTMLSGLATGFATLIVLRIGLAIGEAALIPAGYSLIGDLFDDERRGGVSSIFAAAGQVGAAAAYIIGSGIIALASGWTAHNIFGGFRLWQTVLVLVGLPGVPLALLFLVIGKEPGRRSAGPHKGQSSMREVARYVKASLSLYAGLCGAAGCLFLIVYSLLAWIPYFLTSRYGVPVATAGWMFGCTQLFAGLGGALFVPWLSRLLERRTFNITTTISIISSISGGLIVVVALWQGSAIGLLILLALGGLLIFGGTNNAMMGVQVAAPSNMRATLMAAILMCNIFIGLGLGPATTAAIVQFGPQAMRNIPSAISLVTVVAVLLATAFFALASRGYRQASRTASQQEAKILGVASSTDVAR